MRYKNLIYILITYLLIIGSTFANNNINSTGFIINPCDIDPMGCSSGSPPGGKEALTTILQNFSELLLFSITLIAGISLIIAGYYYIFSSGDAEKANKGKTIIKWNIVALLVAFSSWAIIKWVAFIFTGD